MEKSIKELKQRALEIVSALEKVYPEAQCSLVYIKPYELLIATRLSAQCTDARVNIVTKDLFEKYPTLESFAEADVKDVEEIVRPCGLFRTKAKSIVELANVLVNEYGGELPDTLEELIKLPGIGRKTANLIMGDVYHKPAVVTDTHCIRICGRLGLTENKEPHKVERDLRAILPPERSSDFCHRLVNFGRDICTARKPKCMECPLRSMCESGEADSSGSAVISTTDIPQEYIELVKNAEKIFAEDKSSKLIGVVETAKGEIIGFIDITDDSANDSDRISEENRFLQSIAKSGETAIRRGLLLWKSGEVDIPSANFRKGLEELDSANLEAEFLLCGGSGFLPRKLKAMRSEN